MRNFENGLATVTFYSGGRSREEEVAQPSCLAQQIKDGTAPTARPVLYLLVA